MSPSIRTAVPGGSRKPGTRFAVVWHDLGLDLSTTSVFLDFDGTISTVDVGRRHPGSIWRRPEWWDLHEQYDRGEIGSRECVARQWALAEGDEAALRAIAAEVPLDPGFEPLVQVLREGGAEVTVVSDGLRLLRGGPARGSVSTAYTNAVDFEPRGIRFPHEDLGVRARRAGSASRHRSAARGHGGKTTVLVGDGASDRHAALVADVVFARDEPRSGARPRASRRAPFDRPTTCRGALEPS